MKAKFEKNRKEKEKKKFGEAVIFLLPCSHTSTLRLTCSRLSAVGFVSRYIIIPHTLTVIATIKGASDHSSLVIVDDRLH